MEIIKSLKGIGISSLYKAFKEAFAEYEIQLSEREFEIMISLFQLTVVDLSQGFHSELLMEINL